MSQSMSQPVPQPLPHHIHLVGAGGIMMSGIGEILLARGHTVTGSDLESSRYTERLREHGATIHRGHAAANSRTRTCS